MCNANDVQDEQHVLYYCTHPHMLSLYAGLVRLCFLPQVTIMCLLL